MMIRVPSRKFEDSEGLRNQIATLRSENSNLKMEIVGVKRDYEHEIKKLNENHRPQLKQIRDKDVVEAYRRFRVFLQNYQKRAT